MEELRNLSREELRARMDRAINSYNAYMRRGNAEGMAKRQAEISALEAEGDRRAAEELRKLGLR